MENKDVDMRYNGQNAWWPRIIPEGLTREKVVAGAEAYMADQLAAMAEFGPTTICLEHVKTVMIAVREVKKCKPADLPGSIKYWEGRLQELDEQYTDSLAHPYSVGQKMECVRMINRSHRLIHNTEFLTRCAIAHQNLMKG